MESQSLPLDLAKTLSKLARLMGDALSSVQILYPAITETMASDVLPLEAPEPGMSLYRTLHHELEEARAQILVLSERIAARPRWKFLNGYLLSQEEYYALCLDDIVWPNRKKLGLQKLGTLTDFEMYRMFHYEDDERIGIINPDAAPRTNDRVGARFGRPPEEIPLTCLRVEQRQFFAEYLPDVFARFA